MEERIAQHYLTYDVKISEKENIRWSIIQNRIVTLLHRKDDDKSQDTRRVVTKSRSLLQRYIISELSLVKYVWKNGCCCTLMFTAEYWGDSSVSRSDCE